MSRKIRPIRIEGNIAYVPLTQGYEATIDVEDVQLVEKYTWHVRDGRGPKYAVTSITKDGIRVNIRMHRLIFNSPDHLEVDHIDGNGLNNRKRGPGGNLRLATPSENRCNRGRQANNTSGYKGVSWDKSRQLWTAHIRVNNEQKNLGRYKTPEDAYEAYKSAAKVWHGNFGRIA